MKRAKMIHAARVDRKMRGFTLLETLITVGILAVLLAVAVPAVARAQSDLRMQELDDIARQIFLVEQNRLTAMKATGALSDFQNKIEGDKSGQRLKVEADRPSDYATGDLSWKDLYYLDSKDAFTKEHLLEGSDILEKYLEKGSFMIELNPYTGDVYAVFYVKEGTIAREQVSGLTDRTRATRNQQTPRLGYYGGFAGLSATAGTPAAFAPRITVHNAEDLYLTVECSGLQKLVRNQNKFLLSISVVDEENAKEPESDGAKKSWTKELKGGVDFTISATGELRGVSLVLDSLREADRFAKLTGLTPGSDLEIVAVLSYAKDEVLIQGEAKATANSLFGKRIVAENGSTVIEVSRVRHLNNLREGIYKHPGTAAISVQQTKTIDYDATTWEKGAVAPKFKNSTSMDFFPALQNSTLFTRATNAESFEGKKLELRNFVFGSATNQDVGLFAELKGCRVSGVRLVNSSIYTKGTGSFQNVGLLAGKVTSTGGRTNIQDCWAYIATRDDSDRFTLTPEKLGKCSILVGNNSSNIGGLVGSAADVDFTGCFAAVPIQGGSALGGLVGTAANTSVSASYASGDIAAADSSAGGLIGWMRAGSVTDAYSTSNVTAPTLGGGLLGNAGGGIRITTSFAYGDVKQNEGKWDTETSGPLVGNYKKVSGLVYTGSNYFSQGDYNGKYQKVAGHPEGAGFAALSKNDQVDKKLSNPYAEDLEGQNFPFKLREQATTASDTKTVVPHYGNWPAQLKLQTSLVYYEKYADATYGYYAVTSLTKAGDAADEDADKENVNAWTLDTLRDEACIEDGYALMSIYKLGRITYQLEGGKETTATIALDPANMKSGQAGMITSGVTLEFKKGDLSYPISNAKVYQLPFGLQVVDRVKPQSLYTKLQLSGYTEMNKKIIADYTFFYCPDFAKNAVNPEPGQKDSKYPADPAGDAQPIYVRSARQLNGLGRSYYYWSKENMSGNAAALPFHFTQETDINFGTYTGGSKKYCGETYDLMDTRVENKYHNIPIGRTGGDNGKQFRNVYDGQNNRIIDYCSTTYASGEKPNGGYHFTGLFGEILYGEIKNVHMIASNPGVEGVRSSGYVESQFNGGWDGRRAGVGALVGLLYVEPSDTNPYTENSGVKIASVTNCSVSGYDVIYNPGGGELANTSSATGGLVGYSFGYIRNSTAVNKSVSVSKKANKLQHIGGLAGSVNGWSKVENCYAGGILIGSNDGTNAVAGLTGGLENIYGYGYGRGSHKPTIQNSYSYCTWDNKNFPKTTNLRTAPIAIMEGNLSITNAYYLKDTVLGEFSFTAGAGQEAFGKTAQELIDLNPAGFGKADAAHSFPWSDFAGASYPFPAILKDQEGRYLHFGDWYGIHTIRPSVLLAYYENYQDAETTKTEYNYTALLGNGNRVGSLERNTGKILEAKGYGLLVAQNATPPTILGQSFNPADSFLITTELGNYVCYPFTDEMRALLAPGTSKSKVITVPYAAIDETGQLGTSQNMNLYLNLNFAAAISAKDDLGTQENPLQIRTVNDLKNMAKGSAPVDGHFALTHNIWAGEELASINPDRFTLDGGYLAGGDQIKQEPYTGLIGSKGNYIFGLKQPLFGELPQGSTVKNLALLGVDIKAQAGQLAALALENGGTISNCFAKGSVQAETAAGLIYRNRGTIENSYFSGQVLGLTKAASFVFENNNRIENCFAAGSVQQIAEAQDAFAASGFVAENQQAAVGENQGAAIVNCYTLATVTPKESTPSYGISPKDQGEVTKAYWLRDEANALNQGIDLEKSAGEPKTLQEITELPYATSPWTKDTAENNLFPDTSTAPFSFPRLEMLDYYGDWPIAKSVIPKSLKAGVGSLEDDDDERAKTMFYIDLKTGGKWIQVGYPPKEEKAETIFVLLPINQKSENYMLTYKKNRKEITEEIGDSIAIEDLPEGYKAYRVDDVGSPTEFTINYKSEKAYSVEFKNPKGYGNFELD